MRPRLAIVGAGGHGQSVAETVLLHNRYDLMGYVDDGVELGTELQGYKVLWRSGDLVKMGDQVDAVIVAIGNNALRERLCQQAQLTGLELATVVHSTAFVSPSANVGQGVVVMAHAVIGTGVRVGLGVIVNAGTVVDHHSTVMDYAHLGINVCIAGEAIVGRGAWLQAGSILGSGARVDAEAILRPGTCIV